MRLALMWKRLLGKRELDQMKTDWNEPTLSPRPLGCRTVAEALEAMQIIEELRQTEGNLIAIICDNPEFGGPNSILEVIVDFEDDAPRRFEGETVLACLRAAKLAVMP